MEISKDKLVENAYREVTRYNLGGALAAVRMMPELSLMASGRERLEHIQEDYDRMLAYMRSWYDDPKRGALYNNLLYQLWKLLADIELAYRKTNVRSYADATAKTRHANMSHDMVRSVLEAYVTDLTMMSLRDIGSDEGIQMDIASSKTELMNRHHDFLCRLFHVLWTSPQWQDGEREFYSELLTSSTIDVNDAVTLTGALALGLSEIFDINKMRTLVAVYQRANNASVKQTALVGILLGLPARHFPFDKLRNVFDDLTGDDDFIEEVASLQVQMLNCMNAENDRQVIEKEIMPTLVKNSKISLGSLGLMDDEQSSVDDILHPERQEQIMEEMEEKAMRMMKMQQDGADIYFGGFAQSKRSPFFNEMTNWWMPFSMDHPSIPEHVRKAVENSKFMRMIINKGPFCHSDRYSLLIMGAQVVGRLPKEIEKLENDDAFVEAELNGGTGNKETAANVRRYYLQNLYRFYKLYDHRDDFTNPFSRLFMLDEVFSDGRWNKAKARVGRILMKQKRWEWLARLMETCHETDGECCYMHGSALIHGSRNYSEALRVLQKALVEMPDNERILRLQARALFLTGDYAGAEQTYLLLFENHEDRPTYGLNACISMIKQGKYSDALKLLYQLDFKYENNDDIQRHIAWAQLMAGNTDKALALFEKLTKTGSSDSPECFVGRGYCQWFLHDIESAFKSFKRYCELSDTDIEGLVSKFLDDITLLTNHGIDTCEVYMMADMCRQ